MTATKRPARHWIVGAAGMAAASFLAGACSTSSRSGGGGGQATQTFSGGPPTQTRTPTRTPTVTPTPPACGTTGPVNSYIVLVGGNSGGATPFADTLVATINGDGSLSSWQFSAYPIPTPMGGAAAITSAMWAFRAPGSPSRFVYGGAAEANGTGYSFFNLVFHAPAAGTTNGAGPWAAASPMASAAGTPFWVVWGGAVTDGSYAYTVGDDAGGVTAARSCTLSGGAPVGSWSAQSVHPNTGLNSYSFLRAASSLYTIGGLPSAGFSAVYRAPLTGGGSVGAWVTESPISYNRARAPHQAASIVDGCTTYLFYAGGFDGSTTVSCVYRNQTTSGPLGTWMSMPSLPGPRQWGSLVGYRAASGNYLAVIGGSDGNVDLSTVYYASVGSGGTLGSWQSTTSISSPRKMFAALAF